MQEQKDNSSIGKVVYDYTLNQFAVLVQVYREYDFQVWLYVLEYVDGKKRERFCSEIDLYPTHYAIIEG